MYPRTYYPFAGCGSLKVECNLAECILSAIEECVLSALLVEPKKALRNSISCVMMFLIRAETILRDIRTGM